MTKSFLSANVVLALVFASALFFSASTSFADQGLELRIDSDNNGVIDNSPWERELAKSPFAFGKFIPYSETDEEFVEIQVIVPKAKNADEKRTLKFTFESNEVSLWVAAPDGKKVRLFMPDAKDSTQELKKPEDAKTKSSAKSKKHKVHSKFDFNKIVKFLWDRNIDEIKQEEPVTEIIEVFKPQTFEYAIPPEETDSEKKDSKETELTFYLKAETKPLPADWLNSRSFKRPTRTLTVDLILNGQSISSDSAKYMVVGKESIYAAIQRQPLLSEAIVARAAYYFTDINVGEYGIQLLKLEDMGISPEEFHIDKSGAFSVRFYRDWVHDKYYVTFKGTDIRLRDITNDFLLCTGNPSDYLWKAVQLGYLLRTKPDIPREKIVIIGHSLGGALASGAGIVSEIKTDTFNALGLQYLTIKNTLEKLGGNSPAVIFGQQQIEKSFFPPKDINMPNDREFNKQSVPLNTFHTQADILTLLEERINAKIKTLDKKNQFDILPSALGGEMEIKSTGQPVVPNNLQRAVKAFVIIINVFDRISEQILDQCYKNNQDPNITIHKIFIQLWSSDNIIFLSRKGAKITFLLKDCENPFTELYDQFDYSVERHSMDAVIEEILMRSGIPEAFGVRQKQ